jgi:hypothetical protein
MDNQHPDQKFVNRDRLSWSASSTGTKTMPVGVGKRPRCDRLDAMIDRQTDVLWQVCTVMQI